MAAAVALSKRYQADMEALAPENIEAAATSLSDIKGYAARFGRARALTTAYRAAIRKQLVVVRNDFAQTRFSPWIGRDDLPGFVEAYGLKQGRFDRALSRQETYLAIQEERMQVLARSYGRWHRTRFGIVFDRLEDYRAAQSAATRLSYLTWQIDTHAAEDREADADFAAKLAQAGLSF
jgi:hypothetical protein